MSTTDAPALSVDPAEAQAMVSLMQKSGRGFDSVVRGRSMEPTLPQGAAIRIDPADPRGYRVGQIVVCANGHKLVAHRVVYRGASRGHPFLLTQGDAALVCDPPTRMDAVQGVVGAVQSEDRWQTPAPCPGRPGWRKWAAAINVGVIALCLRVDHRLARFVARALIVGAAVLQRLHRRPAALISAGDPPRSSPDR